jgi:ribosomal protein S6
VARSATSIAGVAGYYVVVAFTADPEVLTELERSLRLADEVLRFKIVVRGEAA